MSSRKTPRKHPVAPDDVLTAHVEMCYMPFESETITTVSLYDGRLDRVVHKESFSHAGMFGAESAVHDAASCLSLAFDVFWRERGWERLGPSPDPPAVRDVTLPLPFGDPTSSVP